MKTFLAFLVVALSGCAVFQNTNRQAELEGHRERTMVAYRDCMLRAADTYKDSQTTAFEGAVAAQAECAAQFHEYREVVEASFEEATPNAMPSKIRALANEACAEVESGAKALVVQRIVRKRVPAKSPSASQSHPK